MGYHWQTTDWKPAESTLGSSVRGELELDWMVVWLHIEGNINKNNQISWNVKKWKTLAPSPSTVVTFQPEQRGTGARHCGRWEIQKYTENRTWHMFQVISDKVYFNVELAHYVIRDTTHDIWPNTNGQRTKTNKFASFTQIQIQISANKWVLWSNSHRIDAPHRLAITLVHCDDTSTTATLIAGDLIIIIK